MAINFVAENGEISVMEALRQEAESLKHLLELERDKFCDVSALKEISHKLPDVTANSPVMNMKIRKVLKAQSKIMQFDWSPDHRHVVCACQNGYSYVWDGFTGKKEFIIKASDESLLACAYSPSTTLVACGGISKRCRVFSLVNPPNDRIIDTPIKEMSIHKGYVTDCMFFGSDQQLLTGSGDCSIALWDMERDSPIQIFSGHQNEVMGKQACTFVCDITDTGLAIDQANPFTTFASCGVDGTARLWDARTGNCIRRLTTANGVEMNSVCFFPTGDALATANSDGVVHVFDLKSDLEIHKLSKDGILFPATSLDYSKSGRVLFVGYVDNTIRAWDALKGELLSSLFEHEERISHVSVSSDGNALASSSWDACIRIWA